MNNLGHIKIISVEMKDVYVKWAEGSFFRSQLSDLMLPGERPTGFKDTKREVG